MNPTWFGLVRIASKCLVHPGLGLPSATTLRRRVARLGEAWQ